MPTVSAEKLSELSRQVLLKAGAPISVADRVTKGLVLSNLKGVDSHGVIRLTQYVDFVGKGMIVPGALPQTLSETPTTAVVDAHQGFGHVGAGYATEIAIDRARNAGVAAVTLRHTRHIGRIGEYVEMAIDAGLVGIACCSAGPLVAPFGGSGRALGTNPIAIGLPSDYESPFVVDIATSVMSEGKVRLYRELGKRLPEGVILGSDGKPSTDPAEFYAGGMLLALGAHKGYALSLAIEILGAVLAGAGTALTEEATLGTSTFGNGGLFIVLDPTLFCDLVRFKAEVGAVCHAIKKVPRREGSSEILVPGEPEYRSQREREASGIPIPDPVWEALRSLGARLGVAPEVFSTAPAC